MTRSMWFRFSVFVLIGIGLGLGLKALGINVMQITPENVRSFVLGFGVWAPGVYLLVYGQPIVPLPATVMTITGGLAFGPVWGTLAALAGATVRACTQFGVARLLGRDTVAKLLKGRAASLNYRLGKNSFKTVLFIRLIPNFPYDVQNYGLGFSHVRFSPFVLATFLGMIPGSFAFVYFGYSLSDPKQAWKLVLAILIIVGLMVAQQKWKARRSPLSSGGASR